MQVTETLAEGLKREFKVVVPASELDERLSTRLNTLKDEVRHQGLPARAKCQSTTSAVFSARRRWPRSSRA